MRLSEWPHHDLSRFVAAEGIRWHVQECGSGAPLLLIHGTGATTHSWRDILPLLAKFYRVVAVDLPGHGFTEVAEAPRSASRGASPSSIRGMSAALAALLQVLRVSPRYCIGHSAGAVVLCQMALDARIEPRAIVSINGAFVPLGGAAGVLFSPIARLLASNTLLPRVLAHRAGRPGSVARVLAGTGSRLDGVGQDLYVQLVRNPRHVAGALAMMGSWDLAAFGHELPRLKTPLALMVGENDRIVPPAQALRVRERVSHATLHRLPGLGHLAHEEQPARVTRELLNILAANAPAGASGDPCDRPSGC